MSSRATFGSGFDALDAIHRDNLGCVFGRAIENAISLRKDAKELRPINENASAIIEADPKRPKWIGTMQLLDPVDDCISHLRAPPKLSLAFYVRLRRFHVAFFDRRADKVAPFSP